MATASPGTTPPHRGRLLFTVPVAVIAALVTLACVMLGWFLGGFGGGLVTVIAAVTGSLWGSSVVLSLPDRLRR